MKPYKLTPRAEQDANDIWDYMAVENVRKADRLLAAMETAIRKIAAHPGIGHYREDLADKRHRFYLVHPYLIIYRTGSKPLQVLRILHASRDVKALLGAPE